MEPSHLYLIVPPGITSTLAPADLASRLVLLLDAASGPPPIECIELDLEGLTAETAAAAVGAARSVIQERNIACVLSGTDPQFARTSGCDGVVVDGSASYASARAAVGARSIVGVRAGASRHDAMLAGESGADFVAIGPEDGETLSDEIIETVDWWASIMEIPCVAMGAQTPDDAARLAACGVEFVALGQPAWEDPANAVNFLSTFAAALRLGGEQ